MILASIIQISSPSSATIPTPSHHHLQQQPQTKHNMNTNLHFLRCCTKKNRLNLMKINRKDCFKGEETN